ncbi:MAG: NUDIX hydrolase [Patescibacteria group bacterium]
MIHKISIAALVTQNDQLLMIKEKQSNVVSWDIPAGGVDQGEALEEAVIREAMEEGGVKIKNLALVGILSFVQSSKTTINFVYKADLDRFIDTSNVVSVEDEEIEDVKLFSRKQVKDIIDRKEYEHKLAMVRLSLFLNKNYTVSTSPLTIYEN